MESLEFFLAVGEERFHSFPSVVGVEGFLCRREFEGFDKGVAVVFCGLEADCFVVQIEKLLANSAKNRHAYQPPFSRPEVFKEYKNISFCLVLARPTDKA